MLEESEFIDFGFWSEGVLHYHFCPFVNVLEDGIIQMGD